MLAAMANCCFDCALYGQCSSSFYTVKHLRLMFVNGMTKLSTGRTGRITWVIDYLIHHQTKQCRRRCTFRFCTSEIMEKVDRDVLYLWWAIIMSQSWNYQQRASDAIECERSGTTHRFDGTKNDPVFMNKMTKNEFLIYKHKTAANTNVSRVRLLLWLLIERKCIFNFGFKIYLNK